MGPVTYTYVNLGCLLNEELGTIIDSPFDHSERHEEEQRDSDGKHNGANDPRSSDGSFNVFFDSILEGLLDAVILKCDENWLQCQDPLLANTVIVNETLPDNTINLHQISRWWRTAKLDLKNSQSKLRWHEF